jgi:5-methylcytosine-specific restriction endonuclease McrA
MRPLKPDEIRRIEDPAHPRGYREWVGRRELARRVQELMDAPGEKRCYVCHGPFTFHNSPTLEHIIPKGSGGSTHDDHRENLALSHFLCNADKGSRRI